jgi:hypothetical protein
MCNLMLKRQTCIGLEPVWVQIPAASKRLVSSSKNLQYLSLELRIRTRTGLGSGNSPIVQKNNSYGLGYGNRAFPYCLFTQNRVVIFQSTLKYVHRALNITIQLTLN